jgi:hypothetical protein
MYRKRGLLRRWKDEEGNFLLHDFGTDDLFTFFNYQGSENQGKSIQYKA